MERRGRGAEQQANRDDQQPTNPVVNNGAVMCLDIVPTYDGQGSIGDFMSIIEETAILANWSDRQKTCIVRLKLRGKAKQFIDSEPELQTTADWAKLKQELRTQFSRPCVKGSAIKNFIECRQRIGETCRQYLTRLKLLANKTLELTGDATDDAADRRKLEKDISTQFVLGLVHPLKQRVLSKNPSNLTAALECAEQEESIENLIHSSTSRECRAVKLNQQNVQPKKYYCNICKKPGHTDNYCRNANSRNLRQVRTRNNLCFKCNKPGHYQRDCPDTRRATQVYNNQNRNTSVRARNTTTSNQQQRTCFRCNQPGHFARECTAEIGSLNLNSDAAASQPRSPAAMEATWE